MINKAIKTGAIIAMGSQVLISDAGAHKLNADSAPAQQQHQQAITSLVQSSTASQTQEK